MKKLIRILRFASLITTPMLVSLPAMASCPDNFSEAGVLGKHIEQDQIANHKIGFDELRAAGEHLFTAKFNICDGAGRPATTGGGDKRVPNQPGYIRTSAPETNSCSGCHSQPFIGGAGEFVTNAFILAQRLDPVTESVSNEFSVERNTLGMNGSGAIEMLAREMTAELQIKGAMLPDGIHTIDTKGVSFKIKKVDGKIVESEGINKDLVVRPFYHSGVLVSLRQFTVDGFNHHLGMQAEERFDLNKARNFDSDFDEDGVHRELSVGDITATTVWQASLSVPQQVMPKRHDDQVRIHRGEKLFADIGCAGCHKPALNLHSAVFSEPNPLNPPGTWKDTTQSFSWDMTKKGPSPRLRGNRDGSVTVRAYTDLKRHNLCDDKTLRDPIRFYCNEKLAQDRPDQDGHPGAEYFITRKLWDVGSSAPYGHRGDITTITEAILYHGGEGRRSRDNFDSLPTDDKREVVEFLKSLQVVKGVI